MSANNPVVTSNIASRQLDIRQSGEKHCHACGNVLHISASLCPHCGASQSPVATTQAQPSSDAHRILDGVYCNGCGTSIHKTATTCPKCGAKQQNVAGSATNSSRSRTTAALFAIFLGGIGAHKFYLGSVGLGFLYLILCWTGISAIIGFIEGIYYFTLNDEEFSRKFG